MIVPSQIIQRFGDTNPYLNEVAKRVEDMVFEYCKANGFAYVGRTKKIESLTEKIESGRYSKWSQLDDLFACSIVIPTLEVESEVVNFLSVQFEVIEIRKRGSTQKDPSVFRFDSTRFIGRLKNFSNDSLNEICQISFEIQIRSAFEHAWSSATHNLVYKAGSIDWNRLRLAAQLKAAVEQLDYLILGFDEVARLMANQFWAEIEAMRKIEEFFRGHIDRGTIPREVAPNSWSRFCSNWFELVRLTRDFSRKKPMDQVVRILSLVELEVNKSPGNKFPRSITLIQFTLGVLSQNSQMNEEISSYSPLVTAQLIDIFPETNSLLHAFEFNH